MAKSALKRGAPVIRWKATSAPASSTTAMLTATAAAPSAPTTELITSAAISPVILCTTLPPPSSGVLLRCHPGLTQDPPGPMHGDVQLHYGPGDRREGMGATAVDVGAVLAAARVALTAEPGVASCRVGPVRVLIERLGGGPTGFDRVFGHLLNGSDRRHQFGV